ncbi:MAG TPA: PAS domain S-box protein, partial [Longimicrobiales bacterium]|nr:PAS domain S-box protein [Longimicrobiales bacterium]
MDDVPGSELPFREALESLGEGIFVCDPEGRLRHANPRFSEITGWSLEEARGRPAARLFVPEEEAPELEARLGLRQPQVPVRQEVHLTRRDGSRIWTEVEVDPLRKPDGTVEGAVGAIMDVT